MNENLHKFQSIKEAQIQKERLLTAKEELIKTSPEFNPEEWKMRMLAIEIEIMSAYKDLREAEISLGLDRNDPEVKKLEQDAFAELEQIEKEAVKTGIIGGESPDEKRVRVDLENGIEKINGIIDKIYGLGHSIKSFEALEHSENPEEKN